MNSLNNALTSGKTFAFNALVRSRLTNMANKYAETSNYKYRAETAKAAAVTVSFFTHCAAYFTLFSLSSTAVGLVGSAVFTTLFIPPSNIALVVGGLITLVGFILRGIRNTGLLNKDPEVSKFANELIKIKSNYSKLSMQITQKKIKKNAIHIKFTTLAQSVNKLLVSIDSRLKSPKLAQKIAKANFKMLQNQKKEATKLLKLLTKGAASSASTESTTQTSKQDLAVALGLGKEAGKRLSNSTKQGRPKRPRQYLKPTSNQKHTKHKGSIHKPKK